MDCSIFDVPRSAPPADRSVFDAWPSMPVYGSLRTLTFCARVPFMDCSMSDTKFRTATDYSVPDA